MEAANKTASLKGIKDGTNHASVKTVNKSEKQGWINSRSTVKEKPHKYSKILQEISVKAK